MCLHPEPLGAQLQPRVTTNKQVNCNYVLAMTTPRSFWILTQLVIRTRRIRLYYFMYRVQTTAN
jgi:hypothetical protein